MAVEADELYSNLIELLTDICQFLTHKDNCEKLSMLARKQANELISRSKEQLQQIYKLSDYNNGYGGAYVDMEKKTVENNDDDSAYIYTTVDEKKVEDRAIVENYSNPYLSLPAKDLSRDVKYGTLSWKCKIILKFEKMRRIYAGIHNNWLLIYSCEKDTKPLHCFHLKFHNAQAVASKQTKNSPQDFELMSTLEGRTYYFMAQTPKDMLQWTSQINRCYDVLNKSSRSVSEENVSETYETIVHDTEMTFSDMQENRIVNKPPDLPARPGFKLTKPLPKIPKIGLDEESKSSSSTYDPVESKNFDSFSSEDEGDNDYEPFVTRKEENKIQPNLIQIKNYNKNINVQPNPVPVKPKTPAKPKILNDRAKYFPPLKRQIS